MARIPRDSQFDGTLSLLRDPYGFISRRCRFLATDFFETRLLLRRTICMTGRDAAALFYDEARFMRHGAAPRRVQLTLLGKTGVQTLDDAAHRHRKQMFLSLMAPERIDDLAELTRSELHRSARRWARMDRVVLYGELHELLTRAVCTWAGVPLAEPIVQERTRQLTALFDGAGAVGPRHWRSRLARQQSERWLADLVQRIRAGQYKPPYWSAAHRIACHRELDGEQLTPQDAAVELLNVLLPTVAVSVYIVFAAHALHCYPRCRSRLEAGDARYAQHFVQEVRRFYPFFPAVPARVRKDFDWRGCRFQAGRRAILDLHGINHDPRLWEAPHEFQPERFEQWDGDQYEFVPQGGGAHPIHHRCPGEWITVALMRTALSFLTQQIDYAVPSQDLAIDCARLPALPRSRFVIADVRLRSIAPAVNGERRRGLTPGAHSY